MSHKDDVAYIRDILTACSRIREILDNEESPDVLQRVVVQDALVHNIQIIGEAANQLTKAMRSQIKEIDWDAMIGMRHRIVHNYFDVDLDIVWDTIQYDLPQLEAALKPWQTDIE